MAFLIRTFLVPYVTNRLKLQASGFFTKYYVFRNIIVPIAALGEKMGDHSFNKPSPNKKVVSDVGSLAINGLPEGAGLTGMLGDQFGSAVRGGVIRAIDKALGPVSVVIDYAIDWGKEQIQESKNHQNYITGIRGLAEKKVSGFLFEERQINGQSVQVAVDASGKLANPEAKPFIWSNSDDPNDPQVKSLLSAAEEKATAELEEFRQTSTKELPARKQRYVNDLKAYTQSIEDEENDEGVSSVRPPPTPQYRVEDDYLQKIQEAHDSVAADVKLSGPKLGPQAGQNPTLTPYGG